MDLDNTVYALNSSTIDLSMTLFPWATFRSTKSSIKIHAHIDLRGPIPVCIFLSPGSLHDVNWLDALVFEPGSIYLFDKGYIVPTLREGNIVVMDNLPRTRTRKPSP